MKTFIWAPYTFPHFLKMCSLCILVMGNGINLGHALLCDCTENECLAQGRAMCRGDASFGCYKEYYSKNDPPVVMGCVRSLLLCDQAKMRPAEIEESNWPLTACCFKDLCNRNLTLPVHTQATKKLTTDVTTADYTLSAVVTSYNNTTLKDWTVETNSQSEIHPVFLLLIILVILFSVVVFASILVIMRIWLYRRRKPINKKPWEIIGHADPHTPTAYLLAPSANHSPNQPTNTNTLIDTYDIP